MSDEDLKRKWDNEAAFAFREEKGKYEGKSEGKMEGKIEGKMESSREIATRMKADNAPVELIAKYTHLSIEEIENLP